MSDEQTPSVDEIKERLRAAEEIPVEEEAVSKPTKDAPGDVAAELRRVGQQFAETIQTAWNSEERQRMEVEVREGVRSFVDEVDKVFAQIRESETAEKVRTEAVEIRDKVGTSDVGQKTRGGFVSGLRWLSDELGRLADRFTPVEKGETAAAEPVEPVLPEDPGQT